MDLDEQLLDLKLNEADRNASENIGVASSYFHEHYNPESRGPSGVSPEETSTPKTSPPAISNMASSREPSPRKPYQATVEDCNSDSDSTLTEPESVKPTTVLKDAGKPTYSNVRKPAKVRFTRRELPVIVHPPPEEKANDRANSSQPIKGRERPKSPHLSAVDHQWGQLFDDHGRPTDRLRSVYRGVAKHLMAESSQEVTVLHLSRLRKFFQRFSGSNIPLDPAKILELSEKYLVLFFIEIRCEYYLVPAKDGDLASEPALTARGFAELMQFFAQIHPDLEAVRLNHIVEELPVEAKLRKGGQTERLPKQLSRRLFPSHPNVVLREKLQNLIREGHFSSASPVGFLGEPVAPRAPSRPVTPFRKSSQDSLGNPRAPRGSQSRPSRYLSVIQETPREMLPRYRPNWQPRSCPDRYDASKRYIPSTPSPPSSDSDSPPPSPKSPSRSRRRERSPSPSPHRHRRNSSPPRRTYTHSRPRRYSDAVPSSRRGSGGLLSTLSHALALHSRQAERRDDRRERDRERRRSYEPSPSDEYRRREYIYYADGRGRRDGEVVPRSERGAPRVREGSREFVTPRW